MMEWGEIMENYYKDKLEYQEIKNKKYNQLDTFYNNFINEFRVKLDPEYISLINKLYQRIVNSRPKEIPIGFKEYFRKYIHFDHFNNDFYTIIWDIELAKKLIKIKNLQPRKIRVKDLLGLVDSENIDPVKLIEAEKRVSNNPVILAEYDPFNTYMLIDGNHRVYSKRNQPNLFIEAYILDDFLSLECMADDVFRDLFILHYNIIKLANYYYGYITKEKLDELLINQI